MLSQCWFIDDNHLHRWPSIKTALVPRIVLTDLLLAHRRRRWANIKPALSRDLLRLIMLLSSLIMNRHLQLE